MDTRKRALWIAGLVVLGALVLTGCAAGANPATDTPPPGAEEPAGIWLGFWHGLIVPITFFISLFTDTVNMYEVHNNGNWYDIGFFIGICSSLGGSAGGGMKASQRR